MPAEPMLLDVRPILASGGHPLSAINRAVDCLEPGQALRLLAPFRPDPLFAIMDGKGFDAHVATAGEGDFDILFVPRDKADPEAPGIPSPLTWSDPVEHFDLTGVERGAAVRHLLDTLDDLAEGEVVFALFRQEPDFLYSDLTSRRHAWVGNHDASGECYRILIRRGAPFAA